MKIAGTVKVIDYVKEDTKWSVFQMQVADEYLDDIPLKAYPEYGEKYIKCTGTAGIELLSEYAVSMEGKFVKADARYSSLYTPELQFKVEGEIDILDSITSRRGLKSYLIRYLPGVGESMVEVLIDYFGLDNFIAEMDKENAQEELVNISGIGELKAQNIKEAWDANRGERDMMIELGALGLSLNKCNLIYQAWGDSYREKLEEDPYNLTQIRGIGFTIADEVARNYLHMDKKDPRRYAGMLEYLVKEASDKDGDSLISKDVILENIKSFIANDKSFSSDDIETIFTIGLEAAKKKNKIIEINPECFVLGRYFHYETQIGKKIMELYQVTPNAERYKEQLEKDTENFKQKRPGSLNESQLEAKKNILTNGISILTGGAGTGKTYTIGNIINTLRATDTNYHIIAPTNKAVLRIKETNPSAEVSTIHKLLGITPGAEPSFNASSPLPYEKILVDESSMIDENIAYLLLSAINPKTTSITFIGDVQQLSPVGVGSFFYDLIHSGFLDDRISYLKVVERTGKGDYEGKDVHIVQEGIHNIVANSLRILNRKMPETTRYDCFNLLSDERGGVNAVADDIKGKIIKIYDRLKEGQIDVNKDFQMYVPSYKGAVGIHEINQFISDYINPNPVQRIQGYLDFKVGDKIFYNDTNKILELTKGDTGYITAIYPEDKIIDVFFYTHNKVIRLESDAIGSLGLGYALTVHKAQGTEIKYGAIILVKSFYMLLANELLYTAYTRCKEKVFLLGTESAYKIALKTHIKARNTYLFHLLSLTPHEHIYPTVVRKNFFVTDAEMKQVRDTLREKVGGENTKIVKVGYTTSQDRNYFRYIYAERELLSHYSLTDGAEIDDDLYNEIANDENIFFLKIVKHSSKTEVGKPHSYKTHLLGERKMIVKINAFDKEVEIIQG